MIKVSRNPLTPPFRCSIWTSASRLHHVYTAKWIVLLSRKWPTCHLSSQAIKHCPRNLVCISITFLFLPSTSWWQLCSVAGQTTYLRFPVTTYQIHLINVMLYLKMPLGGLWHERSIASWQPWQLHEQQLKDQSGNLAFAANTLGLVAARCLWSSLITQSWCGQVNHVACILTQPNFLRNCHDATCQKNGGKNWQKIGEIDCSKPSMVNMQERWWRQKRAEWIPDAEAKAFKRSITQRQTQCSACAYGLSTNTSKSRISLQDTTGSLLRQWCCVTALTTEYQTLYRYILYHEQGWKNLICAQQEMCSSSSTYKCINTYICITDKLYCIQRYSLEDLFFLRDQVSPGDQVGPKSEKQGGDTERERRECCRGRSERQKGGKNQIDDVNDKQ